MGHNNINIDLAKEKGLVVGNDTSIANNTNFIPKFKTKINLKTIK